MRGRWNSTGFQILFFLVLILGLENQFSWSLNDEGLVLLEFRGRVISDPFGALSNWNTNDIDPCSWSGVHCAAGKVQILDLSGFSLEGTLAPELGKLVNLTSLVLYQNHFTGAIPKEIGELRKLELLDLRSNHFSGAIPEEIGRFLSLKHLMWWSSWKHLNGENTFILPIKEAFVHYVNYLTLQLFKLQKVALHGRRKNCFVKPDRSPEQNVEIFANFVRRRLLEQFSNLQAAPASGGSSSQPILALLTTQSSGAYPAIPNAKRQQPQSPVPLDAPVNPPTIGAKASSQYAEKSFKNNLQPMEVMEIHGCIFYLFQSWVS